LTKDEVDYRHDLILEAIARLAPIEGNDVAQSLVTDSLKREMYEVNKKGVCHGGETLLHCASQHGPVTMVELLIKRNADPNLESDHGDTALSTACQSGRLNIARYLLHRGAEPDRTGSKLDPQAGPIHDACMTNNNALVRLLWDHGASHENLKETKETPMHLAINGAALQRNLRFGNDFRKLSDSRLSADLLALLEFLADYNASWCSARDCWGDSPLHLACGAGFPEAIRVLLAHGADVLAENKMGQTPLLLAVTSGEEESTNIILHQVRQHGVNPFRDSRIGASVIARWRGPIAKLRDGHLAEGSPDAKEALMKHAKSFQSQGTSYVSLSLPRAKSTLATRASPIGGAASAVPPSHFFVGIPPGMLSMMSYEAELMGSYECDESEVWYATYFARLELLLRASSWQARACDSKGRTPLHWCPVWGLAPHTQAAQKLIDCSCPLNKQDSNGQTALHIAAKYGHEPMVDLLLRKGADTNIRDKQGVTAGQYAYSHGWPRVAASLGVEIQLSGAMPFFSAGMLNGLDSARAIESACARGGGYTASFFVDQNFPPSLASFLGTGHYHQGSHTRYTPEDIDSLNIPVACKDVEWLRPHEFANEQTPVLWSYRYPKPAEDVVASEHTPIGLLVKSLSDLHHDQVMGMFVGDAMSKCGVYELCLPIGEDLTKTVIIDDHIPSLRGVPLIAHNHNPREYWVPLLVKAIAKLCGGYMKLMRGFFDDDTLRLLRTVCGLPSWLRASQPSRACSTNDLHFYSKWTGANRILTAPKEVLTDQIVELGNTGWEHEIARVQVGQGIGVGTTSSYFQDDLRNFEKSFTLEPTIRVNHTQSTTIRVVVSGLSGGSGEHVSVIAGPMMFETKSGVSQVLNDAQWVAHAKEVPLEAPNGVGALCCDIELPAHVSPFRLGLMVGSWDALRRFGLQVWCQDKVYAEAFDDPNAHEPGAPLQRSFTSPSHVPLQRSVSFQQG